VYNILAVNLQGQKDLIGMYISESEGAKFWLSVFTNLKNRGMQDILIACVDRTERLSGSHRQYLP
jgi:transposase-like protein